MAVHSWSYNPTTQGERSMAECDWAILCDYAFMDSANKMCMIGVFDRVFAPAVPSALRQSSISMKMLGNPGENLSFRVEISRPSGGQLASVQGALVVPDTGSADVQFNLAELPLPDFGPYSVNVFVNNELSRVATFVVASPPQTPQQ
jgi:hypothetical protein